jgi:hypothetical protein
MDCLPYFTVSAAILLTAAAAAVLQSRRGCRSSFLTPFALLFTGTFCAAFCIFLPIYIVGYPGGLPEKLKAVLLSVHNTIRLFIVDGEFGIIDETAAKIPQRWLAGAYSMLAAVLYVAAPLLTFRFILSLLESISAKAVFFLRRGRDAYIFSELNEQSLALAESIRSGHPHSLIVFTDVYRKNEEENNEQRMRAKKLHAVCLREDITAQTLRLHSSKTNICFLTIGADETENIEQAIELVKIYQQDKNVQLYVFSTRVESEMILHSLQRGNIKVRRISEFRSLIFRMLYDSGEEIFQTAERQEDSEFQIRVALIGLGGYGTEMLKAMPWFCQMDHYHVRIDAFEKDPLAGSRFSAMCPELMAPDKNGVKADGEAEYAICIHGGLQPDTKEFLDAVAQFRPTFAFVALENDEDNIQTAVTLRTVLERSGNRCPICAVLHSPAKKAVLSGACDDKGQTYGIRFIGDIQSSCSEQVIINSEMEAVALARHMKWGSADEFWNCESNYRSSVAAAIHKKMKIACGIPGADRPPAERSEEERQSLRKLEHRRWNAYMRAEGYCWQEKRNSLAKTHNCLVPFGALPLQEQQKDDD